MSPLPRGADHPGYRHGGCVQGSDAPEYQCWAEMRRRCLDPKRPAFKDYGGRGITVCERWQASFANFLADMGPRPSKSHTLDRIDNDGNYEPGNCRWATQREQNNNTRVVRLLTYSGETMGLNEWARKIGVTGATIHRRLAAGWTVEQTLTLPTRKGMSLERRAKPSRRNKSGGIR